MSRYTSVFAILCLLGMTTAARPAFADDASAEAAASSNKDISLKKERVSDIENQRKTAILEEGAVFLVSETGRTRLSLTAPAVAIFQHQDELYVALGRQGAVVFDISSPDNIRQVRTTPGGGKEITGFAVIDGEVWVRTVSTKIVPMDAGTDTVSSIDTRSVKTEAAVKPPPSDTSVEKKEASFSHPIEILKIKNGRVTLNIGSADDVQVGDRFSVFKAVTMQGQTDEAFVGSELAAVVQVIAVNKHRCLASLWRGDRVTKSDTIRPKTKEHHRSMVFPRHLTDLGELALTLRPILNVDGPLGFGALNSLSATYWGKHYFVGVVLDPLGFAFTEEGNMGLMNGSVEAGFNSRAFAIGVGAGMHVAKYDSPVFGITQTVRLGAKDGLNVAARNTFLLRKYKEYSYEYYENDNVETKEDVLGFDWGGLTCKLNIPLGSRLTLFFSGGGSKEYFFGEGGVHAWLRGNGDRGSIGLSAAAGAAGLFAVKYDEDNYHDEVVAGAIGPMVSLGLDWRFGFNQ